MCFSRNMQQGSLYVFGLSPKWNCCPTYLLWFKKKSDEVALCSYYKKEINIGSMGKTALTFHLKWKKHQEICKFSYTNSITSLLKKLSEIENKSQDNMLQTSKKQVGIDNMMVSNATTKVEIIWVLNIVCTRYSNNSLSNVNGNGPRYQNCQELLMCFYQGELYPQPIVLLPTSIVYCYKRSLCHIK